MGADGAEPQDGYLLQVRQKRSPLEKILRSSNRGSLDVMQEGKRETDRGSRTVGVNGNDGIDG